MAGLPRPASGLAKKQYSMKPPSSRPSTARTQSSATTSYGRSQSGAASPAESMSTTASQPRSPHKQATGALKRKEREFDGAEGGEETNIHVVVRCRGRNDREVRENSGVVVSTDAVKGKNVELSMGPSALSNKTYHFDKVFSPAADQSMIYDEVVTPILEEMLTGYNCTIFAYGQTGTGKTYTMSGDMSDTLGLISDSAGIIPRVLNSLFAKLDADDAESSVKCSFIELYNEELRDLLSKDDGTKLKIYDDAQKKGHSATMVQGMEESHIKNSGEGIHLLQAGSHKRQVAATKCNDLSSRSHTVFTVTAYMKRTTDAGEDFISVGKLNLVDLAGSENIQRSGAENKRAAEAGLINKSLLTLGRVINALVERGSHIPYRESKLTRLLQDSLGGRTKTCIIATVSPAKSNLEETISTLDYAFRAKNIKNKPQVNSMVSKKTLLKEFTAEIEKLKSELIATRQRNGVYLTAEGYEEIVEQSESRRILSEEQRERIETMEANLRNKVQELFSLTSNFTVLKKDNEATKQLLDETSGVLEKTEIVLADTRRDLADETVLRKAHQSTEEQLNKVGGELISNLEQTVGDISGLHSKIQRKNNLQDVNRQGWQSSQSQVSDVTGMVESRLDHFKGEQDHLIAKLSSRMDKFVQEELEKLGVTQDFLKDKVLSFEASEREVVEQTSGAKDEMNAVLEEIKVLREEVKHRVGEGLNGLSAAAGRISAEVINELGLFHTQASNNRSLHTSYSSLGKDFKNIFEELTKHINIQQKDADDLRLKVSASTKAALEADEAVSLRLDAILNEERLQASQDRQNLLGQISDLVMLSGEEQDRRWSSKIQAARQDMGALRSGLATADAKFNSGMDVWTKKENLLVEEVLKSRDILKVKMKEDWRAINEHNNSIQTTTKSVHEETIHIVEAQVADMAKQMQSLDDFVTRARSQNEQHHKTHVQSLQGLASTVSQSYSNIGDHFVSTYDRVREIGNDIATQSATVQANLPPLSSSIQQPLADLRSAIANAPLREYVSTGETPQRRQYRYPTSLPQTDPHNKLLDRGQPSPNKSPTKAPIYADAPGANAPPPPSPTKDGLREISLNVAGSLSRNHSDPALPTMNAGKVDLETVGMGPPPLKRQATESKLPTKLGGAPKTVVVKLEGRENNLSSSFGASGGRRLRSSPTDR